jgi:hypothetical protein
MSTLIAQPPRETIRGNAEKALVWTCFLRLGKLQPLRGSPLTEKGRY